jgi:hypothetical protein
VAEILAFAAKRLASYKVPDGLGVVDDFPRNALSKVDRNKLMMMAAEALLRLGAAPLQPRHLGKQPVRRFARSKETTLYR